MSAGDRTIEKLKLVLGGARTTPEAEGPGGGHR